jgi:hypothetical protein
MSYLRRDWLARRWVHVSEGLAAAIQGHVWEIYTNSFEHSGSRIGAMSCGQWYPKQRRLGLCIADFGVGIPHKVGTYLKRPRMRNREALRWALESGNSTSRDVRKSRGLGLNLLKEFIRVNDGNSRFIADAGWPTSRRRASNSRKSRLSFAVQWSISGSLATKRTTHSSRSYPPSRYFEGLFMLINVAAAFGQHCITTDDGETLNKQISTALAAGQRVELDFAGVAVIASPFLNAMLGTLLREYTPDQLNGRLQFGHLSARNLDLVRRVIKNSREYFANPRVRETLDALAADRSHSA